MKSIVHFLRLMQRQRGTHFLAIFSLSLGIAVSLLIALGVWEEYRFDRFHKDAGQIYRMISVGPDQTFDSSFRQFGDQVQEVIPEVKGVCRLVKEMMDIWMEKQLFTGNFKIETDKNFFTFFSFPLKYGDPESCLQQENGMIISEKMAGRLFGEKNPLGETVTDEEGKIWKITAVMQDIPYTSHIQADVVTCFTGRASDPNCSGDLFTTYLKIPVITNLERLEKEIAGLNYQQNDHMKEAGVVYRLEALKDVHFSEVYSAHQGNKVNTRILISAAIIILLIACINFVNLFISTSFLRAQEIGVRKAMGASRLNLVLSFYLEIFYYTFIALGIGLLFAWLALPLFNELTRYQLSIDAGSSPLYWVLGALGAVIVLGAGSFPAFFMTRYNVTETLYRRFKGKALSLLRKVLLVVQFTFSIGFLLVMFFVQDQIHYMVHYNLGLEKEQVICFHPRFKMCKQYKTVKNELLKCPAISQVCMRDNFPMVWADGYSMQKPGTRERIQVELCEVEANYFEFMGMQFVAGENPLKEGFGKLSVVLNETAVKQLELKEPLESVVSFWGYQWVVKGVVKDVLDKGLKEQVTAQVYFYIPKLMELSNYTVMCKVIGNPKDAIAAIREQWDEYQPEYPFEYDFLDHMYADLYENEQRLEKIFTCAMLVMMLLSITGLFAMAYFMMQRCVKEIGIRKVNGATIKDLLLLLNVTLLKWVVLAYLLSCGLVWCFMDRWLTNFLYRIQLSVWDFLLAGILSLLIAFATISVLTWRTARTNPVEALKSE